MSQSGNLRKKKYKCRSCPNGEKLKKFATLEEYGAHLQKEHGWCKHCREIFQTEEQATEHAYVTDYHCDTCLNCFENEAEAEAHRKKKHSKLHSDSSPIKKRDVYDDDPGSPLPSCDKCGQSFHKRSKFLDHDCPVRAGPVVRQLQQAADGRTKCYICDRSFRLESGAKKHVVALHHPCSLCARFFASERALESHLASRLHSGWGNAAVDRGRTGQSVSHSGPPVHRMTDACAALTGDYCPGFGPTGHPFGCKCGFDTISWSNQALLPGARKYLQIHRHSRRSMSKHHPGAKFKCATCNQSFAMPKEFRSHLTENEEHMRILLQNLVNATIGNATNEQATRDAPSSNAASSRRSEVQQSAISSSASASRPSATIRSSFPAKLRPRPSGQEIGSNGPHPSGGFAFWAWSTPRGSRGATTATAEPLSVRSGPHSSSRAGENEFVSRRAPSEYTPVRLVPPQSAGPAPLSTASAVGHTFGASSFSAEKNSRQNAFPNERTSFRAPSRQQCESPPSRKVRCRDTAVSRCIVYSGAEMTFR